MYVKAKDAVQFYFGGQRWLFYKGEIKFIPGWVSGLHRETVDVLTEEEKETQIISPPPPAPENKCRQYEGIKFRDYKKVRKFLKKNNII
jgi:hypothetical protein